MNKEILISFINKIQSSKDKKLYILAFVAAVLLIGFIAFILTPDVKSQNELKDNSDVKTSSYELDSKKIDSNATITAPPINNIISPTNNNATLPQTYEVDTKSIKEQSSIQALPHNNMINTQSIDEISNNISNNTDNRDMKTYLKSIQTSIIINQDSFIYNNKTFKVGEKFEGYLIEAITPIFIRFVDDKSALHYNLRFVEEK